MGLQSWRAEWVYQSYYEESQVQFSALHSRKHRVKNKNQSKQEITFFARCTNQTHRQLANQRSK